MYFCEKYTVINSSLEESIYFSIMTVYFKPLIDRILSFVYTEVPVYNFTVFNSGRKFMILLLRFVQAIKMSMVSLNIIYIGQ